MVSHSTSLNRGFMIDSSNRLRFAKKPSAYNRCIGGHLRGKHGGVDAFKDAVRACK